MCFVWISKQTAIISLYSINWLIFVTETECVYCAVYIYSPSGPVWPAKGWTYLTYLDTSTLWLLMVSYYVYRNIYGIGQTFWRFWGVVPQIVLCSSLDRRSMLTFRRNIMVIFSSVHCSSLRVYWRAGLRAQMCYETNTKRQEKHKNSTYTEKQNTKYIKKRIW